MLKFLRTNNLGACAALLACALPALAGQSSLFYGTMVRVSSSPDSNLSDALAAQIMRRRLPIVITPDAGNASYLLAGSAEVTPSPAIAPPIWEARAVLADIHTHAVTWTAEFRGPCLPCDASPAEAARILAGKLIKRMAKDLLPHKSFSDRIDDFIAP
jgi:hypothetical protein